MVCLGSRCGVCFLLVFFRVGFVFLDLDYVEVFLKKVKIGFYFVFLWVLFLILMGGKKGTCEFVFNFEFFFLIVMGWIKF